MEAYVGECHAKVFFSSGWLVKAATGLAEAVVSPLFRELVLGPWSSHVYQP